VSSAGLTENGLMTTQRELAEVIKAAFAQSARHVALLDSGKFDVSALIAMAPLDSLDLIVTDEDIDPAVADRYLKLGIDVAVASGGPE
ncbi:MAG TPA: hypothetical protein VF479_07055, partial [Pseudolysinimonas sp.]